MRRTVQLTVPMPSKLAKLRFPKGLDDRLQFLLDEQSRRGKLSAGEKKEAEGLVQMATTLSILRGGAVIAERNGLDKSGLGARTSEVAALRKYLWLRTTSRLAASAYRSPCQP